MKSKVKGQAMTEYLVLVALIAVVAIPAGQRPDCTTNRLW